MIAAINPIMVSFKKLLTSLDVPEISPQAQFSEKSVFLAEIEGQSGTQKRNLSSDMEEEYIKTTEKFWKRIHFPHRKKDCK
ncbi:unnamed protein product, partial [Brenthis ino]